MFIAQCTNERLKILQTQTKKSYLPTDEHEIMMVDGFGRSSDNILQ